MELERARKIRESEQQQQKAQLREIFSHNREIKREVTNQILRFYAQKLAGDAVNRDLLEHLAGEAIRNNTQAGGSLERYVEDVTDVASALIPAKGIPQERLQGIVVQVYNSAKKELINKKGGANIPQGEHASQPQKTSKRTEANHEQKNEIGHKKGAQEVTVKWGLDRYEIPNNEANREIMDTIVQAAKAGATERDGSYDGYVRQTEQLVKEVSRNAGRATKRLAEEIYATYKHEHTHRGGQLRPKKRYPEPQQEPRKKPKQSEDREPARARPIKNEPPNRGLWKSPQTPKLKREVFSPHRSKYSWRSPVTPKQTPLRVNEDGVNPPGLEQDLEGETQPVQQERWVTTTFQPPGTGETQRRM